MCQPNFENGKASTDEPSHVCFFIRRVAKRKKDRKKEKRERGTMRELNCHSIDYDDCVNQTNWQLGDFIYNSKPIDVLYFRLISILGIDWKLSAIDI